MKRTALALTLILALLFSAAAGTQLVNLGKANPYKWFGWVPPDADTKPPSIVIFSPENNKAYNADASLILNVTVGESKNASFRQIYEVCYRAGWKDDNVTIYSWSSHTLMDATDNDPIPTTWSTALNLTDIPEGNHSIVVYAIEEGSYPNAGGLGIYGLNSFDIRNSVSVNFAIDTSPPIISIPLPESNMYATSDLPLNFTVNEAVTQITYNLDGKENVTVTGNTTLTGLANGNHTITIYATDAAGNVGTSEYISLWMCLSQQQ